MACKKNTINAEKTNQQKGSLANPLSSEVAAVLRKVLHLKNGSSIDETDVDLDKNKFLIDNVQLVSVKEEMLALLQKKASTKTPKNKPAEHTAEDDCRQDDWNYPQDEKGSCSPCSENPKSKVFKAEQHLPCRSIHHEFYY